MNASFFGGEDGGGDGRTGQCVAYRPSWPGTCLVDQTSLKPSDSPTSAF